MKWLDIEIKDIKIKLNEQSVKDVQDELVTQANDITTQLYLRIILKNH